MTIQTKSGKTYEWDGANQPTQEDIAQLEAYDASQSLQQPQDAQPDQSGAYAGSMLQGMARGMLPGVGPVGGPAALEAGKAIGKTVVQSGTEALGAGVGQSVGAALAPVTYGGSIPALGALGAVVGYTGGKFLTGERPTLGGATAAAITGAIPGANLAKASGKVLAERAVGEALANVAAASAQSAIDRGELPAPEMMLAAAGSGYISPYVGKAFDYRAGLDNAIKKDIDTAVKRETQRIGSQYGFNVLPSHVDVNKVVGALEFIGGPSATINEYTHKNAAVVLSLVRKTLGLAPDTVIDLPRIKAVKQEAGKAYDLAASVSPTAKQAVEEYKRARDYASAEFFNASKLNGKARTDARAAAEQYQKEADVWWNMIDQEAKASGKRGPNGESIIDYLEQSKKMYAKASIIEEAFNEGSGVVAADIISKARENGGKLLDGELEVIHKMAQAFPKEMAQPEGKMIPTMAFNRLATLGTGAAAGGLVYAGQINPATAGALTLASMTVPAAARRILSSKAIQQTYMNKSFVDRLPQDLVSMLAERGTMAAGRAPTTEQLEGIRAR